MKQFEKAASEILKQEDIKLFADKIEKEKKEIVIWGAGDCGHHVYDVLVEQNIKIAYFADNKHKGEMDAATGIEIIGADTISSDKEKYYILISVVDNGAYQAIYEQLKDIGFADSALFDMRKFIERLPVSYFVQNNDKYQQVYNMLADDYSKKVYLERMKRVYLLNDISVIVSPAREEYFDEVNVLSDKEVFVDCGGFDGDTSMRFIKEVKGKYEKIVIFEPEESKKEAIKKNLKGENYKFFPYGVWDINTNLYFDARGDVASHISTGIEGDIKIQVVKLDDYVYEEKPTFIKMDIEGAELQALMGTERTIRAYRPKLAVCLYHKPQDLFEIPLYIKSLNKDYNLYIRQYSNSRYETVCYAV